MSTRKTKSESEIPNAAPRRRKVAATEPVSAPKTPRMRRAVANAAEVSEAPDASAAASMLSHEAIATRAYFIAIERGAPGDPVADWLLAEQQLRGL